MGTVAIRFNGQRLDFPETAERTQTFLQKAQEAGKLEGAEKHFHVTANLAAMTALSFFNTLVYGARAIFESAYLAIWDRDEALENFNTQGLYALQSLSYVAAGIFMTLGAIIVPDRVVAQIIQVEPPPPPPPPPPPEPDPVEEFNKVKREFEEKVFPDNPQFLPMIQRLQGHIDLIQEDLPTLKSLLAYHIFVNGLEDQFGEILPAINEQYLEGQAKWTRVKEAVAAQQAFVPQPYNEGIVYAEQFLYVDGVARNLCGDYPDFQAIYDGLRGLSPGNDDEFLLNLKPLVAKLIFTYGLEEDIRFRDAFPHITNQYLEGRENWRAEKSQLIFNTEVERIQQERRLEEDRRILAEQAAELAEMERLEALRPVERETFARELEDWDALIARAESYLEQVNAKVAALTPYQGAWGSLSARNANMARFGGNGINSKRDLDHALGQARNRGALGEIPQIAEARVAVDDYPEEQEFETIADAHDRREAKVLELTAKDGEINPQLDRIAELEAIKAKWDAAVAYSDSGKNVAEEIVALFA